MDNFWAFVVFVLITLVCLKFIFFCCAARNVRYNDWAREEKRLNLLEIVRTVREEKGDYVAAASKSGVPKSKTATRRPARRSVR